MDLTAYIEQMSAAIEAWVLRNGFVRGSYAGPWHGSISWTRKF